MNSAKSMRTFYIIWAGQLLSLLGSGLTNFGLAVWIFEETGRATPFALTVLFSNIPRILLAPVAGSIADRFNRRKILIGTDTGSALLTLLVFILFSRGQLTIEMIYLVVAVGSCFAAFQEPTYAASVTMMVPKEQLARANGLTQMQQALGMVVSPLLAGFLFVAIGLEGIILIDFVTFFFAVGALLLVHIPQPKQMDMAVTQKPTIWQDVRFGFAYLFERKGLFYLLLFFSVVNFFLNFAAVLLGPLILSTNSAAAFGIVQTVFGVGMLAGSIGVSVWGGPERRVPALIGFLCLGAIGLVIGGLHPSAWVIGVGIFLLMFSVPFGSTLSQTLFQTKVEPAVQGRVFAMRGMLSQAMMPIAFIVAGPLADQLFEPWLMEGGALANTAVAQLVGTGPGRGMGLMLTFSGLMLLVAAAIAYASPRLRNLEDELPDVAPEEEIVEVKSEALPRVTENRVSQPTN